MNFREIGSIFIVAGTAIGAGMLALPLSTVGLGFPLTCSLLIFMWGIAAYSALLMLSVNLRLGVEKNIFVSVGDVIGPIWQSISNVSFLILLYALTAAYLAGGASLFQMKIQSITGHELPYVINMMLFVLLLGSFAVFGVKWVDKVGRVLFLMKISFFITLLLAFLPTMSTSYLLEMPIQQANRTVSLWLTAVPIVFTSFGFHVCISSLTHYLDGNAKRLRMVLLVGSIIPLIFYVIWLMMSFGVLGGTSMQSLSGKLVPFIQKMTSSTPYPWVQLLMTLFADFALITSFLGVTMSLFDFLCELLHTRLQVASRLLIWFLTFIPPFVCVLLVPNSFSYVLGFAAIPLVMLILVIPAYMLTKMRQDVQTNTVTVYEVKGEKFALPLMIALAVLIIFTQFYSSL